MNELQPLLNTEASSLLTLLGHLLEAFRTIADNLRSNDFTSHEVLY